MVSAMPILLDLEGAISAAKVEVPTTVSGLRNSDLRKLADYVAWLEATLRDNGRMVQRLEATLAGERIDRDNDKRAAEVVGVRQKEALLLISGTVGAAVSGIVGAPLDNVETLNPTDLRSPEGSPAYGFVCGGHEFVIFLMGGDVNSPYLAVCRSGGLDDEPPVVFGLLPSGGLSYPCIRMLRTLCVDMPRGR